MNLEKNLQELKRKNARGILGLLFFFFSNITNYYIQYLNPIY